MTGLSKKEINITDKDFAISPSLIRSYISGEEMLMLYDNNIFCPNLINGGKIKVNLKDLENKLNDFSKKEKYIKIKNFDIRRTIFSFDIEQWLKDSIKNASIGNGTNRFQKSIKLIKLPAMVIETNSSEIISKFITSYFKKFLEKNRHLSKEISGNVLKDFNKKLGINFYEYIYDYNLNRITLNIKNIYSNIVTATLVSKIKNTKKVGKTDFDKSVYNILKYCK